MRPFRSPLLAAVALSLLIATGCGDGAEERATTPGGERSPGRLEHVDGTLRLEDDALTVTPVAAGATPVELRLGAAVERGTTQALVTSGASARVYYRPGADPVAAKIVAAPTAADGTQTYEGLVTQVSASSITVDGDDGPRTFTIAAGDRAAFDVAHLEEHRTEASPVRVHFRGAGEDARAVAYEDV